MVVSKAKISKYSSLYQKKMRDREEMFIVQGKKGVSDTLGRFKPVAFLVLENTKPDLVLPEEITYEISLADMRKVSTLESLPDIIAVYEIPDPLPEYRVNRDRFSLVLDGIQDPGNLGTIIRTSHWFGIKDIFCSRDTADIYNPKVVQSTMGSIASVRVHYCDLIRLFEENPSVPVYALLLEGENLFDVKEVVPGLIVMGSEGHGPRKETLEYVTKSLTIPSANPDNHPDSLNVAIATAITLSQLLK